jgi:hypothetical protein
MQWGQSMWVDGSMGQLMPSLHISPDDVVAILRGYLL